MTKLRVIPTQLDQIQILSPCRVPWDSMPGNERVRYCGQCKQQVYNVEQLTSGEAMKLIQGWERRVCVRILRRPDGTVVTADCWERLAAARQRGFVPWLATLAVVFFVQLWAMRFGMGLLVKVPDLLRPPPPPIAKQVPPPSPVPVVPPDLYAQGCCIR